MTYRLLDVDTEWPLIEHEFISRGAVMPDPQFSMIVGAFEKSATVVNGVADETETLQGFLVCQLQMHLEPLVLYNPHALAGLVHAAERELASRAQGRYYAFGGSPLIEKICLAVGMQRVPWPIYFKDLPASPVLTIVV